MIRIVKIVLILGALALSDTVAVNAIVVVPEGPIQSLDCLAKAIYWEARGEPFYTKVQEALYIIDIAKSGRPQTSTVCEAAHSVSVAFKQHMHEAPSGNAWNESQQAAILAWGNPQLDNSHGAGAYFIDIHALTRPGYNTVFVEQLGTVLFFKEIPASQPK